MIRSQMNKWLFVVTSIGVILITLALLPANVTNLVGLLLLWAIAGAGQTLVNVPTQTLIADRVIEHRVPLELI